jgi:ubiquinol-cytochrome c reductase cytochrome c subunit
VGALAADFYVSTGYMPLASAHAQPTRSRVLFTRRQEKALVAFVASLGRGPRIPTPNLQVGKVNVGMRLFADNCAGCHQIAAQGGYVTGARVPSLMQATPTQIAEAVRIGPYLMPRFSTSAITPDQLDSLIAYIQYAKHPADPGGWSIGHLGPWPEGLVTWLLASVVLVGFCIVIGERARRT